jgi:hypothetical protein
MQCFGLGFYRLDFKKVLRFLRSCAESASAGCKLPFAVLSTNSLSSRAAQSLAGWLGADFSLEFVRVAAKRKVNPPKEMDIMGNLYYPLIAFFFNLFKIQTYS